MANGDVALTEGMPKIPGGNDRREGYDDINLTRDFLARLMKKLRGSSGTATPVDDAIAAGGTGATSKAGARANLDVPSNADLITARNSRVQNLSDGSNSIGLIWGGGRIGMRVDGTDQGAIATVGDVQGRVDKNGDTMPGQFKNPWARSNGVASWVALGAAPDGTFGFQSSTRRLKKQIKAWSPDRQAVLAMQVVTFRYKVAAWDGPEHESPVQVGMIAEDLHDLGLEWLVIYDDEGLPAGIHYERIALALLPVIQDHEARQQDHEARLTALEEAAS